MVDPLLQIMQTFVLGVLLLRAGLLVAGVIFCWFGYRLFSKVSSVSGAELEAGTLFKARFFEVGPGVFFSLFGAVILTYAIIKPPVLDLRDMQGVIDASHTPAAGQPASTGRSATIAGATGEPLGGAAASIDRTSLGQAEAQVGFVGRISPDGKVAEADIYDVEAKSRQIRLSIMLSVWQPQWGDAADFSNWVTTATGNPNPAAKQFFETK